jgi:hypothetical protein
LKDIGIPGMTIEEFLKRVIKIIMNLSMESRLLHEWYYLACVCGLQFIEGRILKRFSRDEALI